MRCHSNPSRARGLTLIEMMFALIIFGVIAGALFMTALVSQRSYDSAGAYVNVQQQARWAFDNIVNELRQGGGTIVAAPGSLVFQIALGFDMGAVACPPYPTGICWGAVDPDGVTNRPNWSVRYQLNGSQLRRELLNGVGGAGTVQGWRVIANDVVAPATFTLLDLQTVRIQLQVRRDSAMLPGGVMATSLDTRVRLRNNP